MQLGRSSFELLEHGRVTGEELEKYVVALMEHRLAYLTERSRREKRLVRFLSVIDLKGLSMKHTTAKAREIGRIIVRLVQDNYPEMVGKVLIINAPMIFRGVWAVLKPLLAERTVKKISILGADYVETLHRELGKESCPYIYGGSLRKCSIPVLMVDEDESYKRIKVSAGSRQGIDLPVEKGHSVRWHAKLLEKDINVNVTFVRKETNVQSSVVSSRRVPETEGEFKCPSDGSIRIQLDNSFSLFTSKTVFLKMDVLPKPPVA